MTTDDHRCLCKMLGAESRADLLIFVVCGGIIFEAVRVVLGLFE